MKILQINTELTWRGGERQTLYTLQGLKSLGIEVDLLAITDSPIHQKAKEAGFNVIHSPSSGKTLLTLASLHNQYNCIHAQTAKSHTQAILTKPLHRTPIIYTRRVDFVPKGVLTRLKYQSTDAVISISKEISEILSTSGMYQNSPVISSAVEERILDKERAISLKQKLGISDNCKIIGIISALEEHKDPHTAVQYAKTLFKHHQDIHILHFGTGKLFDKISKSIQTHNIGDKYHLLGHYDNVEDFFSIMDIFLMTSKEEGLGSSVLDAFCYHVPVISTDAGGLKTLVNNRGRLCPIQDFQHLYRNTIIALENKQETQDLLYNAHHYSSTISIKQIALQYIKIYKSITK